MATIERKVLIEARPEEVFDLIMRVEDFSEYSTSIKEVRAIGDGKFHWRIQVLGITLEWESEVTESVRPFSFAWRSTSGVYNTGRYVLAPAGQKSTMVCFTMEYRLKSSRLKRLIAPFAAQVMASLFKEILGNVKKRLER